ncbi:alpha/beta hydrolase [Phreatobacter cathodiphilus]|uniref:Alpha/beta hydrolase n=1 Tax=Phreatobacter cathodiphilus TaxID=1868589 RepID=A0A2S0NDX6_9HYPH|nr:alpha/beta hydrolase [Phreatobacter cathodiphilus]AVO46379.1 alpha/beta hydrolase [Phreatobacter cathodiphilus]
MTLVPSRRAVPALLAGVAAGLVLPAAPALAQGLPTRDVAFGPDPRQRLDIYLPRGGASRRPVVFFIYGGSWSSGAKSTYGFVGEAFAGRGYVTVIADYRLVPEVRFPTFIEDGARALAFVRGSIARYGGDPGRLFLAGHSAGAYNAMMLALDPRYLARAGVPRQAVRAAAGLSGPYDFLPLEGRVTQAAFGNVRNPAETQPISFARRGAPRIFLGTGTADTTVLPRNTDALAARLGTAGVPVTVRKYEGVGHAGTVLALAPLLRWSSSVLDDVTAFFGA